MPIARVPRRCPINFEFDCLFYYVSDLDRSIPFYRDILGFRLLSRDKVARFELDGVLFELVPCSTPVGSTQNGNARLCLKVENVAAALAQLQASGVRVHAPENQGTGILGRFQDPDGNELCLWQYGA
jgi:catechol 2,3-dioxygenase-like lactoylglutathione lyase family enzyme